MTAVTLIRAAVPTAAATTYVAVATGEALGVLAHLGGAFAAVVADQGEDDGIDDASLSVDTMPWETLPGVEPLAAAEMAGRPPRTILFVGTVTCGQWTAWYAPGPPPPVPPEDR